MKSTPTNLHDLTLDDALLWLRERVYDADRKAIAALLLTRPDLAAHPAIAAYVWSHIGPALLEQLEAGQPASNVDATILEHLPPALNDLERLVAQGYATEGAAQLQQLLAGLQSRLLNPKTPEPTMSADDLDDLFGPSDDEPQEGQPTEPAALRRTLRLRPLELPPHAHTPTLEIAGSSARLVVIQENDGAARLQLNATLMNLIQPSLELNELQLILRTADGRLLDLHTHYVNTRFQRAQELVAELHIGAGVIDSAGRVDIVAQSSYEFRARLLQATLHLDALPTEGQRLAWITDREPSPPPPGTPDLLVDLEGFLDLRYEHHAEFILQITERSPSQDPSREVVIALRDAQGRVIARQNAWANLSTQTPTTLKITLYSNETNQLSRATSVDLAIKGFRRAQEHIASFEILPSP